MTQGNLKSNQALLKEVQELRKRVFELEQVEVERKQAEEAIAVANEKLKLFGQTIASMNECVSITGKNHRFIFVNEAFQKTFGYDEKEIIGKTSSLLMSSSDLKKIRKVMRRSTLEGGWKGEIINVKKDGTKFPVELSTTPLKNDKGEVIAFAGISTDITKRKKTEEELQESRRQYELATNAGNVGVWDWNLETNEIYIDPNLKAMLGYADHEIRNHLDDWGKLVHPDDAEQVMIKANAHLEGLTPHYEIPHRMLHRDGSNRWFLARGTVMRDVNGKPYRMLGTDTDITELKLVENALRESEEEFKSIVETTPDIIFRGSKAGVIQYVSPKVKDIYGYDVQELVGKNFRVTTPSYEIPKALKAIKIILAGKSVTALEIDQIDKYGNIIPMEINGSPIMKNGRIVGGQGIMRNISERKKAREEIQRKSINQEQLLETARQLTSSLELKEVLQRIGDQAHNLLKARSCDIYMLDEGGKNLLPVIAIEASHVEEVLSAEIPINSSITGLAIKAKKSVIFNNIDNHPKAYHIPGTPEEKNEHILISPFILEGQVLGAMTLDRLEIPFTEDDLDLVEAFATYASTALKNANMYHELQQTLKIRQKMEAALRESEERFKQLAENAQEWIWEVNTDGLYTYASPVVKHILGYNPDEIVRKKHFFDLFHEKDRGELKKAAFAVFAKKQAFTNFINQNVHKDGKTVWLSTSGVSILDEKGTLLGYRGVDTDITERTRLDKLKSVLFRITKAITISEDIPEFLNLIRTYLHEVIDATNFYVGLYNESDDTITEIYSKDYHDKFTSYPARKTQTGYVIKTGEKLFVDEEVFAKMEKAGAIELVGTPSKLWLGVPLRVKDTVIGALAVQSYTDANLYTEKDLEILEYVSSEIALLIRRKQAEEEMQKLAAVVKHSSELVNLGTLDGKMTFLNESGGKMLGIEPHEVENVNIMEVIPDHLKGLVEKELIPALMKGGTWEGDLQYRNKRTGELTNVHAMTFTIKDPDTGEPQFLANVSLDITERKQSEEKLKNYANRISAINEASHTLASSLDLQKVVDRCTLVAKQMFDVDDVVVFILDEDKEYLTPIANIGIYTEEILALRLKMGEGLTGSVAQSGEARIVNRIDLTEIGKQVPGTPVEPESLMSVPLKIKDDVIGVITLSKLGEQEFDDEDLSFIENLADISAVAIQNARLYEEVKQSEKLKTFFLANMSHEIRTPLTAIIGFSELIENSVRDKVRSEERQFFDIIRSSSERLLRTIHNVLDMSQLEAMSFNLRPESIDLSELAEMVVAEHASPAEEKNLDLIYRSHVKKPTIKADRYCISQALSNLLDNAIKYTPKGCITVSLFEEDHQIILQVKDTGIGMTKKYQENLFDMFSQESTGYTKEFQGIGLGLALTRRYLELNEIPIIVTSKKYVGTTFTLKFPKMKKPKVISKKEKAEIPSVEPPDVGTVQGCLLVVDDDVNAQRLFKHFLRGSYQTLFAATVPEAKQQLKENEVDVILLDLSLIGNEDGLDLARYLRKTKRWKELPIIAVTAHAFTDDRDNCLAAGCNDYLSKPVIRKDLLEKIRQYV